MDPPQGDPFGGSVRSIAPESQLAIRVYSSNVTQPKRHPFLGSAMGWQGQTAGLTSSRQGHLCALQRWCWEVGAGQPVTGARPQHTSRLRASSAIKEAGLLAPRGAGQAPRCCTNLPTWAPLSVIANIPRVPTGQMRNLRQTKDNPLAPG